MHLDDERLERLMHGELSPEDAAAAGSHLVECAECRARVAAAERDEHEVFALIGVLDHPAPAVPLQAVLERADSHQYRWRRWAAAAVLVLGIGGVAYALPGSPLRRWLDAAVERASGVPERMIPDPVRVDPPPEDGAGIAVAPGAGLIIGFIGPETGGSARIVLSDAAEVTVRAPAGAATFRAEADRVIVQRSGTRARFDVEIPASAPRVEVRVGTRRVFLKDQAGVTTDAARSPDGAWVVMLGQ
jgi:anti-sigma factor RsiW